MTAAVVRPSDSADLIEAIQAAAADGRTLDVRGGGSKRLVGSPHVGDALDVSAFAGVVDYDPAELVLTARAATPLADIEQLVAGEGQVLAFDPFDHGPILGQPAGTATLGGVIVAGVAGSRRLSRGGARDHLLGFQAVSGRGEAFTAGGKVVKNVTGYDLPKVLVNSWGRLAVITELTVKVLPRAPQSRTWVVRGLSPAEALAAMTRALASRAEVAAAAHNPFEGGVTGLRLDGFGPSVEARGHLLADLLRSSGPTEELSSSAAAAFWEALRTLHPLAGDRPLWRLAASARRASDIVAALAPLGASWLMDWGGGLIWTATAADASRIRSILDAAGGHATLIRGDEAGRSSIPAFHPQRPGVAALEARVRRAFDPAGVFETGRFGAPRHAN